MSEKTQSAEYVRADHPHTDPGDGRSECQTCGKWVWLVTHSCKGVPVTQAAMDRRTCVWFKGCTQTAARCGYCPTHCLCGMADLDFRPASCDCWPLHHRPGCTSTRPEGSAS